MKKILFITLVTLAAVGLLFLTSSCVKEYREGTSMRIDDNSDREVTVGDTVFLKAIISPADESSSVVWGTTDENVAKVVVQRLVDGKADRYVMVLANTPGEARVYVTVNGTMSDTCKIKVNGTPADPAKVTLSDSVLIIEKGYSDTLAYTLEPEGAEASSVVWSVRDGKIAAVSQDGVVAAVGNGLTWVYVKIDDKITDSCQVWAGVVYPEAPDSACVCINGIWWAPVNCGYSATLTYGLLYQFGRKVGTSYGDSWKEPSPHAAEANPQIFSSNPATTNSPDDNYFYQGSGDIHDWYSGNPSLPEWPMKPGDTGYLQDRIDNPCPSGWRVPIYDELKLLLGDESGTISGMSMVQVGDQNGYWFDGTGSKDATSGVFLPTAGWRSCFDGSGGVSNRGSLGWYWSSSVAEANTYAKYLSFGYGTAQLGELCRASAYSVRCVKE